MRSDLVIDAFRMAWLERSPDKAGLLFHSDRGSQYRGPHGQVLVRGVEYASYEFTQVLKECGIVQSMSRKANCLDNACAETLFGSLKVERLHGRRFQTIREAKDEVIAWMLWYNRTRMHSTLGYVSPMVFEQCWNQAPLEKAA
jgi:putative transposase